jgi:tRNA-uridine 2-sulfurtransferase
VPQGSYAEIVGKLRPDALAPGEIVSETGEVVGHHDGIARYTVGQARRLGEAAQAGGVRRVVVALDAARRRVVVGPAEGGTTLVRLREVNWLTTPARRQASVKLRARETPHAAEIVPTAEGAEVHLETPARAAPGQACVFYDGARVLGGGIIRA